ncbi:MAG: hypothetical protein Dbin4_02582 [Alphaproteobacteria bacterium]|nr:hypothetical protein [Alphaproteobacteria bacterium]
MNPRSNSGRKPKPTHLKLVAGNPGHRPVNENEPLFSGDVEKPKYLKGRASKIWDQYAPQLIAVGLIKAADDSAFAALCCLTAEFEKDPAAMVAGKIGQMRALWAEFGMTPSARSRFITTPQKVSREKNASDYFD